MTIAPAEARAVLRVLLAVAAADGAIDDEELQTLAVVGDQMGAKPDGARAIDVDAELRSILSPPARDLTVRAALAIAAVDGICTPEEHSLLERIDAAFGRKSSRETLIGNERQWLARMGDAREALARATDDFLHALARSGGSTDAVAYDALLAQLDERKRKALGAALRT